MFRKLRFFIAKLLCPEAFMIKEQGDAILEYKKNLTQAIEIIKEKNDLIEKLKSKLDK